MVTLIRLTKELVITFSQIFSENFRKLPGLKIHKYTYIFNWIAINFCVGVQNIKKVSEKHTIKKKKNKNKNKMFILRIILSKLIRVILAL